MKTSPNKWLTCYLPIENPKHHIVCFPYGGGAASVYREWGEHLPPGVQLWSVQYPGRENRFGDPYVTNALDIVAGVIGDLNAMSIDCISLFGHSMGAHFAWYCAQQLVAHHIDAKLLMVSGNKPPHIPYEEKFSDASQSVLEAHVMALGGIPKELKADKDFLALYMEKIHADYIMYENTPAKPQEPLAIEMVAIRGEDDPLFSAEEFSHWESYSTQTVDFHVFAGGHFYFQPYHKPLLRIISDRLRRVLASL